jgi:iron complex transport system permease protein
VPVSKECLQCGEQFDCLQGEPGCWCEDITLPAGSLATLGTVADECLCLACLSGYAKQAVQAGPDKPCRANWAKAVPDAAVKARGLRPAWALVACAFLLAALLVALATGPLPIGAGAIAQSALSYLPVIHVHSQLDALESAIVWQIRAPRVVLGALVGGMLATAGSAYQGVFRNPLADPYLLGVAAGAGLGATLAIAYAPVGARAGELLPLAAFGGAVCAVAAAYLLGRSVGGVRGTGALILAGVTVAAFMTAVQTFVQQQHSETLREVYSWILGGLSGATWNEVVLAAPYVAVSSVILLLHRRVLDVLSLGDEEAASLGLNVRRTRLLIVAAATAGTAAAVAVSGLIGFVGIIVPHTVRLLVSSSYRAIMPLSLLVGAGFLVLADVLARSVMSPAELPIGIVTAFFGAPFFALVLRTSRRIGM